MENLGKTVSVFLKQDDLTRLEKLRKIYGKKTIDILRRGMYETEKDLLEKV